MLTLAPGGQTGKHPYAHAGEEFAFVFEGAVVLTVGDEQHRLQRRDAVTIPAGMPHHWENTGVDTARLVVVSLPIPH